MISSRTGTVSCRSSGPGCAGQCAYEPPLDPRPRTCAAPALHPWPRGARRPRRSTAPKIPPPRTVTSQIANRSPLAHCGADLRDGCKAASDARPASGGDVDRGRGSGFQAVRRSVPTRWQTGWPRRATSFSVGTACPRAFDPGLLWPNSGWHRLTLLAALIAWRSAGISGPLRFVSFEAFPMVPTTFSARSTLFPSLPNRRGKSSGNFAGAHVWSRCSIWNLRSSRAMHAKRSGLGQGGRRLVPGWLLPAKNPELWEPDLMAQVARHTAPGGTFATYTAAGHVRRALADAGFEVTRSPGFGRKRHMSQGILR